MIAFAIAIVVGLCIAAPLVGDAGGLLLGLALIIGYCVPNFWPTNNGPDHGKMGKS